MADKDNSRPVNMSSDNSKDGFSLRKNKSKAIKSIIGHDVRDDSAKAADRTQHMAGIKALLVGVAVYNSHKKKVHTRKYMNTAKSVERFQESFQDAARGKGPGGARSTEEIYAEIQMKKAKKRLDTMQRKWPDIARPLSMSQKAHNAFKTMAGGVRTALTSQNMRGIVQATNGSDKAAIATAMDAGYVPGTEYCGSDEAAGNATDDMSL